MLRNFYLFLFFAVSALFSSCEKEESIPPTDYSIKSTSAFELLSEHANGWIEKGRYSLGEDQLLEEFEYYENGYIKSAKVYASYPRQHLYMEVSRSEDNKPLWSKYYTPEGELWFETEYLNGLPSVKIIYSEKGTSVHTYTNGELSSVKFTATDNASTATTTYNATAGTREVIITQNGNTILDKVFPYQEQPGAGIYTEHQVPVANPLGDTETTYYKINQSFSQSPTWHHDADPIEFMLPFRLFEEFYNPGYYFATRFAVSTELYQSVIEQYPVTEQGVLIGGGSYFDGFERSQNSWNVLDSLARVRNEDPELYKLKYGDENIEKLGYGKIFFAVGALRNLPTNSEAADKIKAIAQKRMNELLGGNSGLTQEDREILKKVWFEVKFFSSLKRHRNGLVINSSEDYNAAVQEVEEAENTLIQMEYGSMQ